MGAEIDSLADAVNFGVAPAFIVYATLLSHSRVGWIVVLLYAVCIVLRLARFNALLDVDHARLREEVLRRHACPGRRHRRDRPAGGQDAVRRRLVDIGTGRGDLDDRRLAAGRQHPPDAQDPHLRAYPATWSPRCWRRLAILVAASILYGYITILVIIVAYVIHIPFAIRTRRFLAAHPEVWDDKPRQQRAARRAIRRAQRIAGQCCGWDCAGRAA